MLDIWEIDDDFIIVKLDNYGLPIDEEGTTFTHFLGSIVRRSQYAPINIKSWKGKNQQEQSLEKKLLSAKTVT
ncbi:hypothetical protein MTR_4g035745 [Medicago truncatula]|uniref:Uncharacterized protein n=1 Tax=Medicago truncatula TaxID=3880 RepID=A0A072UI05_MEDTR|nr:hypothetical protein MTR_4g035745 [Medicago truncatula]